MSIRSTYIFTICLLANTVRAQVPQNIDVWKETLKKAVVGKEYLYGKWNKEGDDELRLTYLGIATIQKGKKYKVMNSLWIWGLSHRATSRVLIFSHNNKYIGEYDNLSATDLPKKLDGNLLVFKSTDKSCDTSIVTKIDLSKGLPKRFFLPCENESSGDLIYFQSY